MRPRPVVLLAALLLVAAACHRPAPTRADQHETRTFAASPGKLVRLDLRSLDAEIRTGAGPAIEVEVTLRARSSSHVAARRWVERHSPKFDDSASRLEITAPSSSGVSLFGFITTEGTVRVTLPVECTLEVHTSSGDVSLAGETALTTPVRVETRSGDVAVSGGAGELLLETSSGDVHVTGAPLAVLDAKTSSGDVRLDCGAGRAVIETSSGDVQLHRLTGGLSATTSSGDVEARWQRLPAGSDVRVETGSGDVTLRLPSGASPSGEIRTSNGTVRSDFPGEQDRRGRRLTLTGAAGAAEQPREAASGISLSVRTTSGDVTLVQARPEI